MIKGHHHISMYTKDLKENNYFYTEVLGLRRVKVTVNQQDQSMYHIFYGDRFGTAGNDLTFFYIPKVSRRRMGTNAYGKISLLVQSEESLSYWQTRLKNYGFDSEFIDFYGNRGLSFNDPDNLQIVLLVSQDDHLPSDWEQWENNTVDAAHYILGMGPVEIKVKDKKSLTDLMTEVFKYDVTVYDAYNVLHAKNNAQIGEIIIAEVDDRKELPGRGTIHHLAVQTENMDLEEVDELLKSRGLKTTGVINRYYFDSLYVTESNNITLEIVGPSGLGFIADVDESKLGQQLDLPPFLEDKRAEIESKLLPLDEWI